ncbi:TonB-dependent receptor [Steroidobacter sp. S1-65]|uniref:TonB-dependent receptor n=1 Tax=Steroidobacter gossypii TaxID=2805490 RepID=A0ABS1X3E0_9GAMM|nr:TonB-dependent receptor [Steroidobacter gossypii]MBM0107743.1 TonB-dependent receptor [Steroidobacter gossypii]
MRNTVELSLAIAAVLAGHVAVAQDSAQGKVEEVIVLGRGETRQVQSVSFEQIDALPAGTSPLKAIEKMPGVNFQSADAYGAYEWSTRLSVRGFNQSQLGFTLDGVPLGDMSYANHNGLHISRAIPSEAVGRVELSQGAGAIDIASTSNLGGAVEFFSADPAAEFGIRAEQMFGSDSARRTFAQLDSGELGTGTRAYVAVVDASTEKWKGGGDQEQRMVNVKLVQPIGDARLTAYYNYSDRAEFDYQDLSYQIIERRGWDWDNWYPNWNAAIDAANACNAAGQSDPLVCDDAYWSAAGLRKDDLGYLSLDLPIGEAVTLQATAYMHQNEGQGLWGTPYVPTPGGAPISIRTTEYEIDRQGVVSSLTFSLGAHEIEGGVWFETVDFNQARRFYGEPNVAGPTRSFDDFQRNPLLTQWEYDFDTDTVVFHLQDTWSITDALTLNAGFRSVSSESEIWTVAGGPLKNGAIETDESFLPQVGANWSLSDNHEVFASVARNVRAFPGSNSGPFDVSAEVFEEIRNTLEPETSTNYELGWRYQGAAFNSVVTAYRVDFKDRLLGIPQCIGIRGCTGSFANVGDVKTNGVEAALSWRPMTHLTWFNSAAWNDSEYDDDYTFETAQGVTLVPTAGKQVVDAPEWLVRSELSYDNGAFFARLDANYTDERFYTYLNDASADSYTLFNGGLGYRFNALGVVEQLTVQVDVTNLADKKYIGTIGTNGFGVSDPTGSMQTLLRGAPRQIFISAKARF